MSIMNDDAGTNRHCAACGTAFYCAGRDGRSGCWCDELPRVMPLTEEAVGCLCPRCLEERIERRLRGSTA